MQELIADQAFKPRAYGVGEEWGFLVVGMGDVVVEVQAGGEWRQVARLTEPGAHLSKLSRTQRYRLSPIGAERVFLL